MAADSVEDRYQVIGTVGTADVISSSGIGSDVAATERATHYPIANEGGGVAMLGGFSGGFDGGFT